MQLQIVRPSGEIRQLDEIVSAFTTSMRRVCPYMAEVALREMIQRMALQQLADEQRRRAVSSRRSHVRRSPSTHTFGAPHSC